MGSFFSEIDEKRNLIMKTKLLQKHSVAVVIPCYLVKKHIESVIATIGNEIQNIYVIDDACPEGSGKFVEEFCSDPRVRIIYHEQNQGVGGAVLSGYSAAIEDGADIIVKIDGDGQMDSSLISNFVKPIINEEADYTKGNRFFDLDNVKIMPPIRRIGNAVLSLMAKLSTGYWDLFDPTNGYTAIHAKVAKRLPFEKISQRYFFETDILFRLNTIRAVVVDVPMDASYNDEVSSLIIKKIFFGFLYKHTRNFAKRIFYNYYLRDMSLASIELPIGIILIFFGTVFGVYSWSMSAARNVATPAGTVMLAALPILLGIQFLIAFLGYDIAQVPRNVKQKYL